jgi:hypothetical protein
MPMIGPWTCALRLLPSELKLLVRAPELGEVLRARLPLHPQHPRALLTVLEGLAIWHGQPLRVAINAAVPFQSWFDSGDFGDRLYPGDSPLVSFEVERRGRHLARLRGLADLRGLSGAGRDR